MAAGAAPVRRLITRALLRVLAVRGRIEDRALAAAARRGDARSAARWLLRASRDVAASAGRLHGRRPRAPLPSVLVLARSQFTDDARGVAGRLGVERVLLVRREAMKALAGAYLPADAGDLTYRTARDRDPAPMHAYRRFLDDLWRHLDPTGDVRLVVTANTCYWAEIELGAALEHHGVPFVALHKENLKSPGHAARWEPVYRTERAPFLGRAVLVHNEAERELQVRGEVTAPDRITVVGLARLDEFHAHRERTAGSPVTGDLLFASFLPGEILPRPDGHPGREPRLGLPIPDEEPRPEHLVEACLALHRVAVAVARRLPDRRVVVKTKGNERDRRWVPTILAAVASESAVTGESGIPSNLTVVHGGDAARMTREAAVVAGLNTTMLLEAIAAGRPAVSLVLGEAADAAASYVIDLDGAATVVDTEDAAVAALVALATDPGLVPRELSDTTRKVLDRWTGNPDGRATERTVLALRHLLGTSATGGHIAATDARHAPDVQDV